MRGLASRPHHGAVVFLVAASRTLGGYSYNSFKHRDSACRYVQSSSRKSVSPTMPSLEAVGAAAPEPDVDMAVPAEYTGAGPSSAVAELMAHRARNGRLVAGPAAYSDSDMFKRPVGSFLSPTVIRHAHSSTTLPSDHRV